MQSGSYQAPSPASLNHLPIPTSQPRTAGPLAAADAFADTSPEETLPLLPEPEDEALMVERTFRAPTDTRPIEPPRVNAALLTD